MPETNQSGMVRGYRAIRELLGVRMDIVPSLLKFDAERGGRVFLLHGRDRRRTVRARAADVLELYREWCSVEPPSHPPDGKREKQKL